MERLVAKQRLEYNEAESSRLQFKDELETLIYTVDRTAADLETLRGNARSVIIGSVFIQVNRYKFPGQNHVLTYNAMWKCKSRKEKVEKFLGILESEKVPKFANFRANLVEFRV